MTGAEKMETLGQWVTTLNEGVVTSTLLERSLGLALEIVIEQEAELQRARAYLVSLGATKRRRYRIRAHPNNPNARFRHDW